MFIRAWSGLLAHSPLKSNPRKSDSKTWRRENKTQLVVPFIEKREGFTTLGRVFWPKADQTSVWKI